MSDSLQFPGLQHARLPCPSLTPGVYLNSCPLSWWWHQTISSSAVPFSSCLWSFPASGSFPMRSVLCIRWPVSFSISPSNEYSGLISFRIDWFDFLAVEGTLKNLFQHHSSNASIKVSAIIIPILRRRNRLRKVHWFDLNHRKTVARSTKCTLSNTEAWHCFPI